MNVELRSVVSSELRVAGPMRLEGYGAVFNSPYDCGGFVEVIKPGAFDAVIGDDVRCLFNHDANNLLGRTSSGTLHLSLDEVGLKYECDLPKTALGLDLHAQVSRGDISGSSFSFIVDEHRVSEDDEGRARREILRLKNLFDVGPVTYPAYEETSVHARNISRRFRGVVACRFGVSKSPAPLANLELDRARLLIELARRY